MLMQCNVREALCLHFSWWFSAVHQFLSSSTIWPNRAKRRGFQGSFIPHNMTCVQIWSWYSSRKFTNPPILHAWPQTKRRRAEFIVFIQENTWLAFFDMMVDVCVCSSRSQPGAASVTIEIKTDESELNRMQNGAHLGSVQIKLSQQHLRHNVNFHTN